MSLSAVPPVLDPAATAAGAAWSPEIWRGKTALQMPTYPDPVALDAALPGRVRVDQVEGQPVSDPGPTKP